MAEDGAYGQRLADAMKVRSATSFVSQRTLRASRIAVTDIIYEGSDPQQTTPVKPEDGLLVMTQMRDWPERVLWEDGQAKNASGLKAGAVTIFDLRKAWHGVRTTPVHYMCFYLPRPALDEIGDIEGVVAADEFPNDYCGGNEDPTIWSLAKTLQPAFACPTEANHLFVDHITTALSAHILRQYGGARPIGEISRLSLRQRQRADEVLSARLEGDLPIALLAGECGMAVTEFTRAFEETAGMAPHRWLMQRRLDRARDLLRTTRLSVTEIAEMSGFASFNHFNRVFRRAHTLTPRAWRAVIRS